MVGRRALVVDRDAALLARISSELRRAGFAVESLSSMVGLSPDLIALAQPELVLIDAELPGLEPPALLVLTRSVRARVEVRWVLSTDQDPAMLKEKLSPDEVITRATLLEKGARALGVELPEEDVVGHVVDVRAVLDEVLGRRATTAVESFDVVLDMLSRNNLYVGSDGELAGIFVATQHVCPVGQKVTLKVDLLGRRSMELSGVVSWQRPYQSFGGKQGAGVGVALSELGEEDRAALRRFIEYRAPMVWKS